MLTLFNTYVKAIQIIAPLEGVCVDVLIDDEIDLPARLPSHPKHEGVRRIVSSRKGKNQRQICARLALPFYAFLDPKKSQTCKQICE